jgi:ketosteroid isomerase-like protein
MADAAAIVRGFYTSLGGGDIPGAFAQLAPDVTWTEATGFPYGGTYHGPNEVLQKVFMRLGSEWDGFTGIPAEFIAQGDTVVVLGQYSGTYKATAKKFNAPFAHVWTVKNGKLATFRQYTDTALAREAVR